MSIHHKRYIISGKVQGVFFRGYTKQEADKLGLLGWVKNLKNGNVETEIFTQDANMIEKFEKWLKTGSPLCKINNIRIIKDDVIQETEIPKNINKNEFEILK